MSASVIRVAYWRQLVIVAVATLIAFGAVAFAAPQEAHAFRDPSVVLPSHEGWVNVRARTNSDICGIVGPCGVSAWRWSGYQWTQTRVLWGSQVYAYPYTGDWHWIWTSRTGWLAIKRAELDTGNRCPPGAYC